MDWDQNGELGEEPAAQPKASDSPKDGGGEAKGKDKGDDVVAKLTKQVETLTKRQNELQAENEFWQRRLGGQQTAAQGEEDDEDGEEPGEPAGDDEPILDAVSKKGIKALLDRGMLTKAAAEKMFVRIARDEVAKATQKLQADAALYDEVPELKDKDSEVTKLTAKYFQQAIKENPANRTSHFALAMAAKAAKAEIDAKQARSRRDEEGEARRRRIAVQDPGGDGWGGDELDDSPSPLQLQFAQRMGLDEETARGAYSRRKQR